MLRTTKWLGQAYNIAIRAVTFQWIRIVWQCWQDTDWRIATGACRCITNSLNSVSIYEAG